MKNHLLSLICFLLISSYSKATNLLSGKDLIPITVTMKDGQIKKGKVKDNLDPDKKIALTLEDGSVETLASENVKEFTIEGQNGALITYENVAYFKNAKRKEIASKTLFMMVLMRDPAPIAMYYQIPWQIAYGGGAAASMSNTTNFFAQRKGEPAATLLSSVMMGQVNPNAVFRDVAPDYFADYPELARKIENKTYTYADIMTVAQEYTKWKTGDNNSKEIKK